MMDMLDQITHYGINAHSGVQPRQIHCLSGAFVRERQYALFAIPIALAWKMAYMRGYQYAVEYFDRLNI